MSKRYLCEVLNICQDNNITVYYVDTDSIHVEKDKISFLERLYFEKYNKALIGKNLGQFHCDFNIQCGHNERVMSNYTLILGPKAYFDELECEECQKRGTHYRMKGIPQKCIENYCQQHELNIKDVYKLLTSQPVTFVLNPPDMVRFMTRITGVLTIEPNKFTRTVKF